MSRDNPFPCAGIENVSDDSFADAESLSELAPWHVPANRPDDPQVALGKLRAQLRLRRCPA
jgi:hypothetical protein